MTSAKRFLAVLKASLAPYEAYAWFCTAVVLVFFVAEFTQPIVQADDAFISYRYALNLARGHGLVFNPGEYVEGFTNLLWTLMVAALIRVGAHAPAAGQALSIVFGSASLVVLHIYVRRFLPRRLAWFAAAAPVAMLASNSFACWMSTGLETPLFLFLTTAALLAFDMQRPIATAWLCVLCLLCRPEGGIEAAVLLGVPWLVEASRRPRRFAALARSSVAPLIFVASAAALTAFRLYYYGDYVPNTFHAKVGQAAVSLGWVYLEKFLLDGVFLLIPGVLIAARTEPRLRIPLIFTLVTTVYVVAIGGDVFAYGRFLLPVLPVLFASAASGTVWLLTRSRAGGIALMLAFAAEPIVTLYINIPLPIKSGFDEFKQAKSLPFPQSGKRLEAERHYFMVADEKRLVRKLTDKILRAKPGASVIACIGIGKMGFYNMNFTIIDMVGLTDRHVAESTRTLPDTFVVPGHSRTDSDYILSRKPDVIIIPSSLSQEVRLPAEVDMLANPKLRQDYIFVEDGGFWIRK
jgi:arabinofuranosyltransferase